MSNILKELIVSKYGNIATLGKTINMPLTTLVGILDKDPNNTKSANLKKICDALNIDMYALLCGEIKDFVPNNFKLTLKEKQLIEDYRRLDQYGIDVVDQVLHIEKERNEFYENRIEYLWKPKTYTQAAAGFGQELSDYSEFVKIPRTDEAEMCDFVCTVSGNSMSPTYEDGDCVLVKSTKDLNIGDIGIFILNNEAFIKTMGENSLISQNPVYEPILIKENDICLIIGKVLNKTEVIE